MTRTYRNTVPLGACAAVVYAPGGGLPSPRRILDVDGDTAGSSPNSFAQTHRSSVPLAHFRRVVPSPQGGFPSRLGMRDQNSKLHRQMPVLSSARSHT